MSFAPGKAANPYGRPSKQWAEISYWFNIILKDSKELTPLQRVEIAKWSMEFLVENAKALPAKKDTQKESADLLASLEATSLGSSSVSTVKGK